MNPVEVELVAMRGVQCSGTEKPARHTKPFIGLSDLAQLTFCEIQSTISQLASQEAYAGAALADDHTKGVRFISRADLTASERAGAQDQLQLLTDVTSSDPLLRRLGGNIAESLELSGTHTERRHFDFGDFFVIGCPDALNSDAVKEFARSRYPRLALKGKAIQSNLYAVLWHRASGDAVVINYDGSERAERTVTADVKEAERWLSRAWLLIRGSAAARPPENSSRCRSCIYNERLGCPFPKGGRVPEMHEMVKIAELLGS